MFGRSPRASSRPLLVAHAKQVFSLLSTAQQVELIAAFERFDLDGSGTMCAADSLLANPALRPTAGLFTLFAHRRVRACCCAVL